MWFTGMYLQKQPVKHVCGSGCERAPSQDFTSNHRGKNSSSCPCVPELAAAGWSDLPCQTRVCAVMLSLESCFTSMCTLTKTHIAVNACPWATFPSSCDAESFLLSSASFQTLSIMQFQSSYGCNWYCLEGPTLTLLALEFAAILRSLFF